MTLDELETAMQPLDLQALTIAYVSARGEWQASLRPWSGTGWRIATATTIEEAVTRALGPFPRPVVSDSSSDEVDLFG